MKTWHLAALLFATVILAYVPAFFCGYVWDDDALLTRNPPVLTGRLIDLWRPGGGTLQYYPTVFTAYWVEHKVWGLHPFGYHLVNVLLHAGSAVLLWLVLRRLSVPGAFVAAFVFGLHPVQVESVAWITARKNLLSGLFYLGSVLAYLGFALAETDNDRRAPRLRAMYLLAFLLFTLAVLSKSVTCTLPAALLVLVWWKRGRIERRDVLPLMPMFVLGAGLGLLTAWMEKNLILATGPEWQLSFLDRCLIAGRALWFYAGKLLWPVNPTFIYPRWEVDAATVWPWLFPLGALALIAVLLGLRRRLGRGPLAAALLFAGTLFPALGFFDAYPMRYSFVADHFQYLACIGIIVPVVWAVAALLSRFSVSPRTAATVSAAVLGTLAILTARQCLAYRGEEILWNDTIRKNPVCWMAHYNLGNILAVRGDVDEAITHYQAAVDIKPDHAEGHNNLGTALISRGRTEEGLAHYRRALAISPDHAESHYNLGVVLGGLGRTDEAIAHCRRAAGLKPDYAKARYKLGVLLAGRGDRAEALIHLQKALAFAEQQGMTNLADSIRARIRSLKPEATAREPSSQPSGPQSPP